MEQIMFWTQSLDNESSDIIGIGEKLYSSDDQQGRTMLRLMSKINSHGKIVFEESRVRIIVHQEEFSLTLPCEERDSDNRLSKIVCISSLFDKKFSNVNLWTENLICQAQKFAAKSGRKIQRSSLILISEVFVKIKKKRDFKQTGQKILFLIGLIALVALVQTLVVTFKIWQAKWGGE